MMNKYILMLAAMTMAACSDDNGAEQMFQPTKFTVTGKVEKGPFISGSSISIQPMDARLQVTGNVYSSTIRDDEGNFSFGSLLFEAPFAELTANGYFFNETRGALSQGTLHLRALADLSEKETVNVNLLTHLKYERMQRLIAQGKNFKEADRQAQEELFGAFGLQRFAGRGASTFSMAEGTEESAALIAISSLMLCNRSEAELTEYLARLSREFGETGRFGAESAKQMNKDREELLWRLPAVTENVVRRYRELGRDVEVKDLQLFFDWDGDGTAGNEILREGETAELETTEIVVPPGGGDYAIGFSCAVPVYLEAPMGTSPLYPDEHYELLYETEDNGKMKLEKRLENQVLHLKVGGQTARTKKTESVWLYDYVGNEVAEVKVVQEGNAGAEVPRLGPMGKDIVNSFTYGLAEAFSNMSLLEQYYHFNRKEGLVERFIDAGASCVLDCWAPLYKANLDMQTLKNYDSRALGAYGDVLDVFSAIQYYYLVSLWGDIPYLTDPHPGFDFDGTRTAGATVLGILKGNLEKALESLEEKRNVTLSGDVNENFFVSKDVARIVLAKIHMDLGEYDEAEPLLRRVAENGFYELDGSDYNLRGTIEDLFSGGQGKETILAFKYERESRSGITVAAPALVPVMTYTDVLLSYAECLYRNGRTAEAEMQLNGVLSAKGAAVAEGSVLERIAEARHQLTLFTNTNFSFMKRSGFATEVYGVEPYRLLLPIPQSELSWYPRMTQNPGY